MTGRLRAPGPFGSPIWGQPAKGEKIMNDTTTPTPGVPAMQDYECRVFHLETYIAFATIRAENPQKAMERLQEMEADGDLDFMDFCDSEPANEFIVETPEGEAIMESRPEYCLYAMRDHCRELAKALAEATSHLPGAARNAEQLGQTLEAQRLLTALSAARSALANVSVLSGFPEGA
jgi:hypothetical protein